MTDVLLIDGSSGEGGGQIVRSSLALAMLTGRAVRLERIRAGRAKPGLQRQHLTAVQAAASICGAQTSGDRLGSGQLSFVPGPVQPGEYELDIGSAGSTTLVLQTALLPLLVAAGPSTLTLKGGTHNPLAPPFEFLAQSYLPLVNRLGPRVRAELRRPGFFPVGGGELVVRIEPCQKLAGFEQLARGPITRVAARALVSRLPRHIAERELAVVAHSLRWPADALDVVEVHDARGPGNIILLEMHSPHVVEVASAVGSRGVPAEAVAAQAVAAAERYLASDVPIGEHLADQLLLPLAAAGSGRFRTLPLSSHAATHIELIRRFLEVPIRTDEVGDVVEVAIGG